MRIIRNYFLKEFFQYFIYSLLGITLIMVFGNLIRFSDMIIRKGIPFNLAAQSFLYYIPYLLQYILPLACLLGVLLSLGRITSENELASLKISGISASRILSALLVTGIIFSLFSVVLHDKIIPRGHFQSEKVLKTMVQKNPASFVEPGVFIDQFKDFKLFTHDVDANVMKRVYIYGLSGNLSTLTYADKGYFVVENDVLKIRLQDGFVQESGRKFRSQFKNQHTQLRIDQNKPSSISKEPKDMGIKEIWHKLKSLEAEGLNPPVELEVEFHRKLSVSFSCMVFILLGFGIAGVVRHREKSLNLGLCFLMALLYYLFSLLGETFVIKSGLPAWAGGWSANVIFLTVGLFLSYKVCRS